VPQNPFSHFLSAFQGKAMFVFSTIGDKKEWLFVHKGVVSYNICGHVCSYMDSCVGYMYIPIEEHWCIGLRSLGSRDGVHLSAVMTSIPFGSPPNRKKLARTRISCYAKVHA
jgi:hypothetical protein